MILHVQEIIDFAFEKNSEPIIKDNAFRILSNFQPVRKHVQNSGNYLNFIIQHLIESQENTLPIIRLLRELIERSNATILHQIDDSNAFFQYLLNNITLSHIKDFLIFLFANHTMAPFRKWFADINVDVLLYTKFVQSHENEKFQEDLLLLLLNYIPFVNRNQDALSRMGNLEKFSLILKTGIEATSTSLSSTAFKCCKTLLKAIDENRNNLHSQRDDIMNILAQNCEKLCNYSQRDHTFKSDKKYAIELIMIYISHQENIDKYLINFAHFLLDLFLEFKTNSFLHNTFFNYLQCISFFNTQFESFITSSKLLSIILEVIKEKTTCSASYYGHIYKITGLIYKMIQDGSFSIDMPIPTNDNSNKEGNESIQMSWEDYIHDIFNEQKHIIKSDYGGPTPLVNKTLYNYILPDSFDLLSHDIIACSSSSSSSSESSSGSEEELLENDNSEEKSSSEEEEANDSDNIEISDNSSDSSDKESDE